MGLTAAQIKAAVDDAVVNRLAPAEMAALLERAIVEAIISSSGDIALPWVQAASDSTQIMRIPLDAAQALLKYFLGRANGGIVAQLSEFRNPDGR